MKRLSIKELQKYQYPNLIAEIIESGYSICTVGDHMELGRYLPEDSPEVWDKLTGKTELLANEAIALSNLFGAKPKYLFSHELAMIDEKPYAYWRWLESNKRKEREHIKYQMRQKINMALEEKPYLLELVNKVVSMSEAEVLSAMEAMQKGGAA